MSSSKKPSGSFNRKRKLQHSKEDEKQSKALQRFFSASTSLTKLDDKTIIETDDDELSISEAVNGPSTSQQTIEIVS